MFNPVHAVSPQGGRLCRRNLSAGSALVGVMHLPEEFTPVEGACYAMVMHAHGLEIETAPVGAGLEDHMRSWGVGNLLTRPIWNRPRDPSAMPIRFIEAFPQDNVWTVYGATPHTLPATTPDHEWFDIQSSGLLQSIEAPFEAAGSGIGQLLSTHAVWPDRQGQPHTLPQIQASWRAHYLSYHQLLASAATDPSIDANLEERIARNPFFRELSLCRVDRMYCAYLAELQSRNELVIDAPRTAAAFAQREQLSSEILEHAFDGPAPRKGPRPA